MRASSIGKFLPPLAGEGRVGATRVGIIGAGPAGLMLSDLLHRQGIASVVFERHSRDYVERRVRAGVLEQGSTDLLASSGVGERMIREGLAHDGIKLRFAGEEHRIDFRRLTGKGITVYGQQEVVKDLIAQRLVDGGEIWFETEATAVEGIEDDDPRIAYRRNGEDATLTCEFVAGCDGSHGISRTALASESYARTYPFSWLGILAKTPPASDELIYAYHDRGFALHSMRSPEISRLYLQVDADDTMDAWPEPRIWDELRLRLAERELHPGEIIEAGITPMRSRFYAGISPLSVAGRQLCEMIARITPAILFASPDFSGTMRACWRACRTPEGRSPKSASCSSNSSALALPQSTSACWTWGSA